MRETSSPEWASTNASYKVAEASFWIWMTWVSAIEPSYLAKYSIAGKELYPPLRAILAVFMADSRVTVGFGSGMDDNKILVSNYNALLIKDSQGSTKDEPNATTLLSLLKATFATAFANVTPF